mgnify:CR=1 FL=1
METKDREARHFSHEQRELWEHVTALWEVARRRETGPVRKLLHRDYTGWVTGLDAPHDYEAAVASVGPGTPQVLRYRLMPLEVTIFEEGVPPEFRIHTYRQDKPLPPAQSSVQVTLERLGREPQVIRFSPQDGYLKGDAEVVEPHSFKVTVQAVEGGREHRFSYEQVEARVTMSDAQLAEAGVKIVINTDAHRPETLELIEYGIATARRAWLTADQVQNTRSWWK